ncbi:uncharacterized protein LOC132698126 [Cylas formicarius]|uniref:uncharacterized protein LOC132698126 n=1 Tax=Cylas formicarius TaxID=197179 RepID=UPI0029583E97|nr:uncharacterized protein LOC132698126 [Cylas formicarius]
MFLSSICAFAVVSACAAKIYDKCELARELKNFDLPDQQIPTWVCIAKYESLFDTSATNNGTGDHGLFQISQQYWCSPPGFGCNKRCSAFRDDDIADDVECIRRIFNEHKRLSGDGFNAWAVYPLYCSGDNSQFLKGCPDGDGDGVNAIQNQISSFVDEFDDGYEFPPLPSPRVPNAEIMSLPTTTYRVEEKKSTTAVPSIAKGIPSDTFTLNITSKPKTNFTITTKAIINEHQFITPRNNTTESAVTKKLFSTTTSSPGIPSGKQLTFPTYFPSWFQTLPPAPPRPTRRTTQRPGSELATTFRPGLGQQTTRRPLLNRPGLPLLSGARPFNQRPWRPFGSITTSQLHQLGSETQSFSALRFEDDEPDIMLGSDYIFRRTQFGYRLYRTV